MTDEDRAFKVIALPNTCVGQKLKSFTIGENGSYLYDSDHLNVYEIIQYKEDNRSWFIGELVSQDGSLMMVTRVDPLFLIIPDLVKNKFAFHVFQDIVGDKKGAETLSKVFENHQREFLSLITEVKDFDDDLYYRLDEKKLIVWLKAKVRRIVKSLKIAQIDVSSKSTKINNFSSGRQDANSEKDYIAYALNLLSKYLSIDLVKSLQDIYDVKINAEPEPITTPKGTKRTIREVKSEKCEPTENYYAAEVQISNENKKFKLNKSQRELQQAAKKTGVRKIDSFFKKK